MGPQTRSNQTKVGKPETHLHPGLRLGSGQWRARACNCYCDLKAGTSRLTAFCACPWPSSVPTAAKGSL